MIRHTLLGAALLTGIGLPFATQDTADPEVVEGSEPLDELLDDPEVVDEIHETLRALGYVEYTVDEEDEHRARADEMRRKIEEIRVLVQKLEQEGRIEKAEQLRRKAEELAAKLQKSAQQAAERAHEHEAQARYQKAKTRYQEDVDRAQRAEQFRQLLENQKGVDVKVLLRGGYTYGSGHEGEEPGPRTDLEAYLKQAQQAQEKGDLEAANDLWRKVAELQAGRSTYDTLIEEYTQHAEQYAKLPEAYREHSAVLDDAVRQYWRASAYTDWVRAQEELPHEQGVEDLERRIHHLHVAAENLHEAGFPDRAQELEREAQELHAHLEDLMRDRSHEGGDLAHRIAALEDEVHQLRHEVHELRALVEELRERIQEGGHTKGFTSVKFGGF